MIFSVIKVGLSIIKVGYDVIYLMKIKLVGVIEIKGKLKNKKLFSIYLFISSLGGNVLGSIFVLFLSSTKGFTAKEVSLIIGITPLVVLPIFFIWGGILDKYKKIIFFSKLVNISNIISMLLLIIIKDFELFFMINLIRSILLQPSGSLNDKYLLNLSKGNKNLYGKIRVFATVGFGITGLLSPVIIRVGGVSATMFVGIVLIILSVIVIGEIPEIVDEEDGSNVVTSKEILKSIKNLFKNRIFIKYLIILSIINGTQNAASGYGIQIMLINLNAPDFIIGVIPFMMVIFEIIILLTFEKITFLKKRDNALMIALMILVVRWGAMTLTSSYILVVLITIMHGLVAGAMLQIQNKLIGDIVPSSQQFSAFMIVGAVSGTMLPSIINLLTGNLYESMGLKVFGLTYLGITLIAIIILFIAKVSKSTKSDIKM